MKICFVTVAGSPDYLGGYSLYHKNLIKYIKAYNKNIEVFWVYFGDENREYDGEDGVHYYEIKSANINPIVEIIRHIKLVKFFKKHNFDIINSIGGIWTYFYKKKDEQRIIHTYHGTSYYFNKNQLEKYGPIRRTLFSFMLILAKMLDRPHKNVDKIICVSDKVKKQVQDLFGKIDDIVVIRTGVDLNEFKPRDKNVAKITLGLIKENKYALYVGGGGYWGKGLDRAIKISEEIYKNNPYYRLLVIGADYKKVRKLVDNSEYTIFLKNVSRNDMYLYYDAADMFFSVSRYEGGAPTMVTSEAMASGCLLICSKDAEQEIIIDGINGIVCENFDEYDAKRIIEADREKIITNELDSISDYSFEKWGKKCLDALEVNK